MAQRTRLSLILFALLSGLTATSVWAQPPRNQAKPTAPQAKRSVTADGERAQDKDRAFKRPDARALPSARIHNKKLLERMKMARPDPSGRGQHRGLRGPHGKMSQALKDRLKELATTRAERRSKRRAEISKRWGEWVHRREFRSVFRRHAWRMARLRRIVELATEQKNPTLKERAEKLIEKEDQRYAQRLEKLKERAASAAGSAAAPPSTAPPSVAPATSQD